MANETISRSSMIETVLKNFPDFYANEDIVIKRHFLAKHFKCNCTDCGGPDSIGVCKVEEAYFIKEDKMENPYYESFGNPVENVIINTEL